MAVLAGWGANASAICHYVDPGGYTPLFPILSSRRPEIRAKRLTFLLTLGILPGLSELFPVYVARTCFDQVEGFEYVCVGRDRWTFPSAWDIAWGVGNIGNGEAPVYYEQGVRCSLRAGAWIFPRPWGGIRSSG